MPKYNTRFIASLTLAATFGGLLFGYDTAVINGAIGAIKSFFIQPLHEDTNLAAKVIWEYKLLVALCFLIITLLINSFLFRLYGKGKALVLSILVFVIIFTVGWFRFFSTGYQLTEGVENSLAGFTVASALIGCIIGGSIGGYVSQNIGRRKGLLLASALFFISAIGSAWPEYLNFTTGQDISSFIVFRIIGGIGVGLASMLSPMYIAEIAPAGIRGKLVSWNQFAIIFGMLVVYFVNYFIAKGQTDQWINATGWRWMFASEAIPAAIFFVMMLMVPETPRYLILKNQRAAAQKVLVKVAGKHTAEHMMHEISNSLHDRQKHWLSFGGGLIVIGILLSVFQQFVGINVVLYYSSEIFRNMGINTEGALLQTIVVGAINLIFTVLAIFTVDRFGRKPLLIIGGLSMAIGMIGLGFMFYLNQLGLAALFFMLFYTAAFAVSWGPVVWVMLSEIFPNSIRGALSIAVAAQWIANLAVSWTFEILDKDAWLVDRFNHGFAYWIYGAMGILSAVFVWKMVPETKGKSLEKIENIWRK
jgi:SP family xylose:H+ symportor-like MFS transporter